jgi:hypothetical protein
MEKLYPNLKAERRGLARIPTRETNSRSFVKELAFLMKLMLNIINSQY